MQNYFALFSIFSLILLSWSSTHNFKYFYQTILLITFFIIFAEEIGENCVSSNEENGRCNLKLLCTALSNIKFEYNKTAPYKTCGSNRAQQSLICCPNDVSNEIDQKAEPSEQKPSIVCPRPVWDRLFGGNTTLICQYPYIALLEYRISEDPTHLRHKCSGVLIHRRFVLTAAHCITNHVL